MSDTHKAIEAVWKIQEPALAKRITRLGGLLNGIGIANRRTATHFIGTGRRNGAGSSITG